MNALPRFSQRITAGLLCSLFLTAATLSAQDRPPVSWVNPGLPDGPGLEHHVFDSAALGHEVGYVVWTPPDYDTSGATRYPVVFFLHGMGGHESADAAGFSGLLAGGIRSGKLPPLIAVFPNGGRSGYRGEVESMIVDELLPLVDASYPTIGDGSGRALAGFSMGGGGAVRLLAAHPGEFCSAGSWGGGAGRDGGTLLAEVEKNAAALRSAGASFLLVNGDGDRPEAFAALAEKLDELEIAHRLVVLPETGHNLSHYYQRAGEAMILHLGRALGR